MAKGGRYEWELCRQFSLWASGGIHDDWYTRSSGSGGRSTVRAKKGKRTVGHAGDIAPTCAEAEFLTQFVTIESKRGENSKAFMADLIDRDVWPAAHLERKRTILGMIEQAKAAAKVAKTPYWMLVHRRDKREALAYFPIRMAHVLDFDPELQTTPAVTFVTERKGGPVTACRLESLLLFIRPRDMKRALNNRKGPRR